ncbi:MAG: DEAD/DEAH box helicase [Candidatus Omnitrophica bacterium]|nr:DEAD/DEAH box helicase [Candidatus Omnitrophota bacterium]MBU4334081.1 DEAD/DEAH box helicase [Candidatus Omnitrophota bacterium]
MNLIKVLENNGFTPEAIKVFANSNIKDLYPPQAEAIKKNVLNGKNLLMSVPTAAGKTLIAELSMIKALLTNPESRCLYIAPLKALASEKYKEFKAKYKPLGIDVGLAIGDSDTPKKHLNRYQILVATAEKIDSMLRSRAKWLIDSLSVIVLDEIHFINDNSRGPTLEILAARIRQLNPKIQFLALSATVSNADEIAKWLDAELVKSDWRPIPLKEGVYHNEKITFKEGGVKIIAEEGPDDLNKLVLDTLRAKGQVLIFVASRRSAQAVSRQIAQSVAKVLTADEKTKLLAISKKIAGSNTDSTKVCRKLAEVVAMGSAFHHAGLKPDQRELVEEFFKNTTIKVISCTPTLAAGVNLPARRAIIRDVKRFEAGLGAAFIPTSEYKQCAGRAGRPQYDDCGEAVLIAKTKSEESVLFEKYILAAPEPVTSKLDEQSALRIHSLASVAGGYVYDMDGMFEFISHTFLYHQKQSAELFDRITQIFLFLQKEGFIENSSKRFFPTVMGNLTSRLYIDPISSIIIRDGLNQIKPNTPLSQIGALHLMTCCPDGPLMMGLGKNIVGDLEMFVSNFQDDFILNSENFHELDDYFTFMRTVKTTWFLSEWIEEEREEAICERFNIGPGDIYRYVDMARRLLYATGIIAEMMNKKKLTFEIEALKTRVQYGIKEDLLDIIQLKGVGRVRARNMHNRGIKKLTDLRSFSQEKLAAIPAIGKALAKSILEQV